MTDTAQYLLFLGLLWGVPLAVWLWLLLRPEKDAEEERQAREAWAAVVPREGCTRKRTAPSGATGEAS